MLNVVDMTQGRGELFPTIVRRARERAQLTQAQLAAKCGVRQPSVAHWESGRQPLMESTLKKIADGLSVPLADMLHRELAAMKREQLKTRRRKARR